MQSDRKRLALAQSRRGAIGRVEPRHEAAELRVLAVAQDERLRHRVAERSDADLQRAPIGHSAGGVEAGGIFRKPDRLARRSDQGEVGARSLQHQVEFARGNVRVAGHERELGIDLAYHQKVGNSPFAAGQRVEREIGIAAQAEAGFAAAYLLCDELGDHIYPAIEQIAEHVGIIGADVITLGGGHGKPRPCLEEELINFDVGREVVAVKRDGISEIGITAEQPLCHGLNESPLELGPAARPLQRERGEDAQPDRGIRRRARKQRIGDVIGFAESQRQRQHDVLAHTGDDRCDETIGIFERNRRAAVTRHVGRSAWSS